MKDNKPFWLLHALGPVPVSESNGGDLKWLGAVVEDINSPMQKVDWRPSGLLLEEHEHWESVPINEVQVLIDRASSWSVKADLAKSIGINIDRNGRVKKNASKQKIVAYRLLNDEDILQKMLDTDNHRAKVMPQISRLATKRWFIVGYLVAKPADKGHDTNPLPEDEPDASVDDAVEDSVTEGVEQSAENVSQAEGFLDPLTAVAAATGIPAVPLQLQVSTHSAENREVKGDPTVSHIFAICFKGLRKQAFGSGAVMRGGPKGDNAFGDRDDSTESEQQQAGEAKEDIFLATASVVDELEAQMLSDGGEEDAYIETENIGNSLFADADDAAKFESLFGGQLDLAFKEVCGEE
ncbi:hypothetical protein F5Y07DRAFT_370622 [Xylaria sp. FL0933]|nr:hypothetical protein F5Y07DRAFT_370622 [Xylaria sp. FL0933]